MTGTALSGLLLLLAGLCMALFAVPNLYAGSAAQAAPARPTDTPSVGQAPEGGGAFSQEEPRLQLVASDEQGIVLEFTTPAFQVAQATSEDASCQIIGVAGLGETDRTGWPRLPVRGAMVGIPPDVEPTLTVLEADAVTLSGRYDLCPVPQPILEVDRTGGIAYRGQEAIRDREAYATAGFYPPSPAEIVSTGLVRSQRVAQIRFHPFRYDPVSGELQVHGRIRVRLEFVSKGGVLPATGLDVEEGSFEEVLDHLLLNYDTARRWRIGPAPRTREPTFADPQPGGYKVLVDEDGLYEVTHSDLISAGVDLGDTDPHTLRLYNRGQEVAIQVAGEEDGSFDEGDSILFYGQKMNTKYTDVNVYWLSWGGDFGRRMPEQDGTPSGTAPVPPYFQTTQRVEKDLNYQAAYPSGPDQDHWYWNWLWAKRPTPATADYPTRLQHLATFPLTATVHGLFRGYDAIPQHHTRVYLNGHLIDDAKWLPMAEYTFTVPVSQSLLIEGTNTISVECPLDEDITEDYVIVNRFEIDYYDTYVAEDDLLAFDGDEPGTWEFQVSGFTTRTLELLDVTTPSTPTRILSFTVEPAGSAFTLSFEDTLNAGDHYLAQASGRRLSSLSIEEDPPSDLRSATHGADYLIITHADFYTDLLPLAAHRAAQGLRTLVVDVQDVYDEFSYGIFDPEAIHDFLAYAYAHWQPPAPAYVLLVGDGNYDFKDNFGFGEPSYIPPYLADVDPWISEVAADNRYACVSGDDILPDMHLGRLPVKTSAEASAVVAKILAYEKNRPGGDWNQQVLFVADNADGAGDFAKFSDDIANNFLPSYYNADRVYYKVTHSTAAGAKAAIINAINEGRLLVNYVGHAYLQFWAEEHLFDLANIAALTNARRLPLVVPMTCLDGYYTHPSRPGSDLSCVGESFVRAPGGGSIASWSPTGLGVATGHDYLNKGLFEAIFFDHVAQVGPATTQAKLYLYGSTGGHLELLDSYILFGDPALYVLAADVQMEKTIEPPGDLSLGDALTYTLSFTNAGPSPAYDVVLTDIIPPQLAGPVVVYSSPAVISQYSGITFAWTISNLLPHTGGEIQIRAVVATGPGLLVNEAVIAARNDVTPTNNTDAVTNTIRLPDLVVGKIGPAQVGVGEIITYTITWGNQGAIAADGARITDTLPSWVDYVGDTSGFARTEPSSGTLVWQVTPDPLPATAGGAFVLTGSVMADPGMSGPLLNRVEIGSETYEGDPSNDEGQWSTDLLLPDVGVRKTGPRWAFAESTITYTIEYSNGGQALAPGVVITDLLPAGVTYLGDDSGLAHSEPLSGTHVWQVGQLPVGDGDTFHLVVSVGSRPEIPSTLTNRVWIRAASPDENPANGQSQHVTGVPGYWLYLPLVFKQGPGY